ncbi:MAG: SGNH/GDSL hydrolase family protein [Fibrobacteres bacterium]|nr:SGNH/GDSL hydrolase family protein [Fibrobacterota bacterium]
MAASIKEYLLETVNLCKVQWPANRTVNLVFHGHSVPSGYFCTPAVDTLNAYPHLTLIELRQKFPFSVINTIVTAIGGENSEKGAARFETEVLNHRPDVLFIDYGLNDRGLGLATAKKSWSKMIELALKKNVKVILLTPTLDNTVDPAKPTANELYKHVKQIEGLAKTYKVGLVDSYNAMINYCKVNNVKIERLLSQSNHPNKIGHEIVASQIINWFPM